MMEARTRYLDFFNVLFASKLSKLFLDSEGLPSAPSPTSGRSAREAWCGPETARHAGPFSAPPTHEITSRMKYSPSRNAILGVTGVTVALSALLAVASAYGGDDCCTSATASSQATNQPNPATPGMIVAKDPVTGQLRAPSAEEMAALQPVRGAGRGEAKEAPLRSERLANGAVVTTLNSSYEVYSVATKDADGKIQTACVPAEKVEAVLDAAKNGTLTKKEVLDEK